MGTRSLLAYEKPKSRVYFQYMQFDGYPTIKGREYYEGILKSLQEFGSQEFYSTKGVPNDKFFRRCLDFLNNIQYMTGHSVGNHATIPTEKWLSQDSWQEWQYLFDIAGNFHIIHTGKPTTIVIPWDFTMKLATSFSRGCSEWEGKEIGSDDPEKTPLAKFWEGAEKYLRFDPQYAEKGEKEPPEPIMTIKFGESHAFPEQKDGGWRGFGLLSVGSKVVGRSMFFDRGKRRNEGHVFTEVRKAKIGAS